MLQKARLVSAPWFVGLVLLLVTAAAAHAQQPTSQVLTFNGNIPGQVDGPVAVRLRLYDLNSGGTILFEETQTVNVAGEKFTALIGNATNNGVPAAVFQNNISVWIAFALDATPDTEIGTRPAVTSSGYAHYAVRSLGSTSADGLSGDCAGCVQDANIGSVSGSKVSGAIPVESVPAGSGNYIQNTTTPQSSNFNISGNGAVGGTLSAGNVGIGTSAPSLAKLQISGTDTVGYAATMRLTNGNAGGADAFIVSTDNYWDAGPNKLAFGLGAPLSTNIKMSIDNNGNVGIGTAEYGGFYQTYKLEVRGSFPESNAIDGIAQGNGTGVYGASYSGSGVFGFSVSGPAVSAYSQSGLAGSFDGRVSLYLGNAGATPVCQNNANELAHCSSSLRYKTNVRPFFGGLDIVKRLRPIAFSWKQGGMRDIGLGAEEVEKVEPLLTFRNNKGEIEGVKYSQMSAVFVNAFVEQQQQIGRQQSEIKQLRVANAALNARLQAVERVLTKRSSPRRRSR